MKFGRSRLATCLVILLALFCYSNVTKAQSCPGANDDDLWIAGSGIDLPDEDPFFFDDCRSEIPGLVADLIPDGWVLHVVDDDGQQPGDDEDRSSYCKSDVFDDDCQSAIYEVMVRPISGDSDPPHDIHDIVLIVGLRDGVKSFPIIITEDGVGFVSGSPLDWLQIDDGMGGTMDAFYNMVPDPVVDQHIYTVVKDGTDTITLFVGRDEKLSFDYDELPNTTLNQSILGATGAQIESEYRLRYYRHRTGATEFQTADVGCDADFNVDDEVDGTDLLALLANWGPCPELPESCPWDIDEDGKVGASDLLSLLASWGPCT